MIKKFLFSFKGASRSFAEDSRGVILIFTALAAVPTSAVVYSGLDVARGYAVKNQLVQAVNLGLVGSGGYILAKGKKYKGVSPNSLVRANFAPGSTSNIKVSSSLSGTGQLTITASASLKTRFNLGLLSSYLKGIKNSNNVQSTNKFTLQVSSAGQIAYSPMEIAFAVDTLDFKAWNGQTINIPQLLMTTTSLYNKLKSIQNVSNNLKISIIPYANTTNVMSSLNKKFLSSIGGAGCVSETDKWWAADNIGAFSPYRVYFFDQFSNAVTKGWENHGCPIPITPLTTNLNAIRMGVPVGYSGPGYSLNPVSYVNGLTQVSRGKPLHNVGLSWAWRSLARDWGKAGAWSADATPSSDFKTQKAIFLLTGSTPAVQTSIQDYMNWWNSGEGFYLDLGLFSIWLFDFLSLTNIDHYSAYGYRYDDGMDPLDLAAYVAVIGWSDYYSTDRSLLTPTDALDKIDKLANTCFNIIHSGQGVNLYSFGIGHEHEWIDASLQQALKNYMITKLVYACNTNTDLAAQNGWGSLIGATVSETQNQLVTAISTALDDVFTKAAYVKLV